MPPWSWPKARPECITAEIEEEQEWKKVVASGSQEIWRDRDQDTEGKKKKKRKILLIVISRNVSNQIKVHQEAGVVYAAGGERVS